MRWLTLAGLVALQACAVASYDPGGKRCDPTHACPGGFDCVVGLCVKGCAEPTAPCTGSGCTRTLAGTGAPGYLDGDPISARFRAPTHLFVTPRGVVVADTGNDALRLIPLDGGPVSTLIGPGVCDLTDPDSICEPRGIAPGPDGEVYVVSTATDSIHRVQNGTSTRIVGDGLSDVLGRPLDIAVAGRRLLVTDTNNCALDFFETDGGPARAANGAVVAPLGGCSAVIDGRTLTELQTIAVSPDQATAFFTDLAPSLYAVPLDAGIPSGPAHRLTGGQLGFNDGPLATASFSHPTSLAADATGVYVADEHNNRLRYVQLDAGIRTVAGLGFEGVVDGPVGSALISEPGGVAVDGDTIYFSSPLDHRIRRVRGGQVDTVAGGPAAPLTDGCADAVGLAAPTGIDARDGNTFFTDALHHAVRVRAANGAVLTLAGGSPGAHDDAFEVARFNFPGGVRLTPDGGLIVADTGNGTLRRLDLSTRVVTTLAGVPHDANFSWGTCSPRLSNPPNTAVLCSPKSVAVAPTGEIYFSDASDDGSGVIGRLSADFEQVDELVRLDSFAPRGLVLSPTGTLVAADAASSEVREYDTQGNALRVLVPNTGCGDFGAHTEWSCDPAGVAYVGGDLLVLYRYTSVVRRFPGGGGAAQTVLGTAFRQGFADGLMGTLLDRPLGFSVDASGAISIADARNNRLRFFQP